MSRTHKDRPWKLDKEQRWDYNRVDVYDDDGFYRRSIEIPGVKTKKKKHFYERQWMTTPMHWIREMMNQPQRAKGKQWEKKVMKTEIDNLIDIDPPNVSRKPHIYYW